MNGSKFILRKWASLTAQTKNQRDFAAVAIHMTINAHEKIKV